MLGQMKRRKSTTETAFDVSGNFFATSLDKTTNPSRISLSEAKENVSESKTRRIVHRSVHWEKSDGLLQLLQKLNYEGFVSSKA